MKFHFELAQPVDDPALRKLLAETPMPGRVSVAFEREPNYFSGCSTMGPFWQVVIARDASNQDIAGVFCRAVRSLYINGVPHDVGYIGQIRIAEKYRGQWLLQQSIPFFKVCTRMGECRFIGELSHRRTAWRAAFWWIGPHLYVGGYPS